MYDEPMMKIWRINKSIILFTVNGKNDKTDKMGIEDCCNFSCLARISSWINKDV
jgi:hypothetical protein